MNRRTELQAELAELDREEALRQQKEKEAQKATTHRLIKESHQDAVLKDTELRMQPIKEQVGDLIHDPDFLWFMLSMLMTTDRAAVQQKRPNSIGYTQNTFTNGLIEAYKRKRTLQK